MKKVVAIFTLFVVIGIIMGCNKKMAPTVQQQPEPQQATQKPPTRWLQHTYPAISSTDPVNFYNEFEINIVAKIPKKVLMFQDGITYEVDSSIIIELTVYKLTSGVLKSVKKENGLPVVMEISFDEADPNYTFSFFAQKDRSFCFGANVLINYEGKKYKATATIKGKPDGLNHLLSNFESLDNTTKNQGAAAGAGRTGTKVIKTD